MEASIVVIGGGGAGLPAALTAVEKGIKDVVLLEKRLASGGNAALAGGFIFAAESRLQKEAGFSLSRDDVFKETMSFHHYDLVNPRILRVFINKSAETIDWLESYGILFQFQAPGPHIIKDIATAMGGFGAKMKILDGKYRDGGGQVLLRTSGKEILLDSKGGVAGVAAAGKEGGELRIKTRSVIIATGGFTGNKELLRGYFPSIYDDVYWTDAIPNLGDGLQLAATAGAALEDYATLIREPCFSFTAKKSLPHRASATPSLLWVNARGERFVDEASCQEHILSVNALLRQPGKVAYALYDDELVEKMTETDPDKFGLPDAPGGKIPQFRETLEAEAKMGEWVAVADSWEELAPWLGAEPATLQATVDEYNSFCDRGYDETFAKEKQYLLPLRHPPYYALKFRPLMIDTAGPVRINERMEVLDKQDSPIPGLYAAGAITSGWQAHDYHLSGSALGYSINSGRIAGENAAAYIASR
jgi:fumarate reductase flavoprotein subunit